MLENNYIWGRNSVIEALTSDKKIEKIYVQFGTQGDAIDRIFRLAKKSGVQIANFDKSKFQKLEKEVLADAEFSTSQGIIALLRPFDILSIEDFLNQEIDMESNPFLVILDEITDPHNLGAIARTAECAGAMALIITEKNSAPLTPAAIKASSGALEHIPVIKANSLPFTLKVLKDAGFWIIGTDATAERDYTDNIYNSPVALIIGSEGKGVRPSIIKQCDFLVKIPLQGKVNSLNASVSAAIVMYEVVRQKQESRSE